jgi:hypothetical protein
VFDHNGYTDCVSCHAGDAPSDHFPGQCSNCHNPNGWGDVNFNHDGLTDCISCHLKDRPDEHDQGQCSNCHDTGKWDDKALVIKGNGDLINVNCSACHSPDLVMGITP